MNIRKSTQINININKLVRRWRKKLNVFKIPNEGMVGTTKNIDFVEYVNCFQIILYVPTNIITNPLRGSTFSSWREPWIGTKKEPFEGKA